MPAAARFLVIVEHAPRQAVPVAVNDEVEQRAQLLMNDENLSNNERRDRLEAWAVGAPISSPLYCSHVYGLGR